MGNFEIYNRAVYTGVHYTLEQFLDSVETSVGDVSPASVLGRNMRAELDEAVGDLKMWTETGENYGLRDNLRVPPEWNAVRMALSTYRDGTKVSLFTKDHATGYHRMIRAIEKNDNGSGGDSFWYYLARWAEMICLGAEACCAVLDVCGNQSGTEALSMAEAVAECVETGYMAHSAKLSADNLVEGDKCGSGTSGGECCVWHITEAMLNDAVFGARECAHRLDAIATVHRDMSDNSSHRANSGYLKSKSSGAIYFWLVPNDVMAWLSLWVLQMRPDPRIDLYDGLEIWRPMTGNMSLESMWENLELMWSVGARQQ